MIKVLLDALLLAQENLWLFYNGFDVNDGEVREPSSILQEFREHLALIVKAEDGVSESVVIEGIEIPSQLKQLYHLHDLQPFDPKGFTVEKVLFATKITGLRSLHKFSKFQEAVNLGRIRPIRYKRLTCWF